MGTVTRIGLWTSLLCLLGTTAYADDLGLPLKADGLPPGWAMQSEGRVSEDRIPDFEVKNGGDVEWMATQYVNVLTRRHQVHTVLAATEADAVAIAAARAKAHGEDFVRRRGLHVLEVVGADRDLAARMWALLGLEEKQVRWHCVFRLACLDRCDDDERELVAWRFGRLAFRRDDEQLQEEIRAAVADWTFAPRLTLPLAEWTLRPAPSNAEEEGRFAHYAFEELPEVLGVPYVDAEGDVEVSARYAPDGGEAAEALRAATDRWPAGNAAVVEAARQAVGNAAGAREQVLALLGFLDVHVEVEPRPAGNQAPRSTRDAVPEVLARGRGSVLERCDAFVTLARALGLAARQVAGWRPDLEQPHLWAEVHLPDEGWIPVDPATVWLGVSARYLPLLASEDGRLPLLHLARPRVRRAGP